mgnify:CR=1 FL=1
MIAESYVSFDTARMLKEAGFDVPCNSYYSDIGIVTAFAGGNFNAYPYATSRPTQALAARWLREVHRIALDVAFIPPSVDGDVWQYFVGEMDDMIWKGEYETGRKYTTYEEAFEAGLQEAIKLIKKQ